ncbi:MAG: hypothetical protein IBJ15_00975 [Alphaproteobacteria bacterium]|nr:hypothetical protein [Alphaproteobacteria bacterium]
MIRETQIVANDNECVARAVLFDACDVFGGLPLAAGWVRHIRRRAEMMRETSWLEDALPKAVLERLRGAGVNFRIVEIPFAAGEKPEIDALLGDLFDRSGLPPNEARERMQRFEAAVAKAIQRSGNEAAL